MTGWVGYTTDAGSPKVEAELEALPLGAQAALLDRMRTYLTLEPGAKPPWVKKIVNTDLWEIKASYDSDTFRVLFAPDGPNALAVMAVQKKTQRLPRPVLRTASRRLADWRKRSAASRKPLRPTKII